MMWTAPSIDKFDKLKKEVEERKKNAETEIQQRKENLEREIQELKKKVEREIKQLRKILEWEIEELHALEKLKINSETAIQLFESGVDDFEKKRISMANSDSEPKKKKEKRLKLTDSLIPFSNKGTSIPSFFFGLKKKNLVLVKISSYFVQYKMVYVRVEIAEMWVNFLG